MVAVLGSKILDAFSPSPWGKDAFELSKDGEPYFTAAHPPEALLEKIKAWMSTVRAVLPPTGQTNVISTLVNPTPQYTASFCRKVVDQKVP
jgi:hypothetical protein